MQRFEHGGRWLPIFSRPEESVHSPCAVPLGAGRFPGEQYDKIRARMSNEHERRQLRRRRKPLT